VEVWLAILNSLPLRDLYSLTVTSKFFYNNFNSIYRIRVARERILRPKRPTEITSCAWMSFSCAHLTILLLMSLTTATIFLVVLIASTSFVEATFAGILIVESPDSSQRACLVLILIACCYSCILAILNHANTRHTLCCFGRSRFGLSRFGRSHFGRSPEPVM
jgi:hypothetical protein